MVFVLWDGFGFMVSNKKNNESEETSGRFDVSCPCFWKREVELEEPPQRGSPSKEPEDPAKQKAASRSSWGRRTSAVLAFALSAATVALIVHLTCESTCCQSPPPHVS